MILSPSLQAKLCAEAATINSQPVMDYVVDFN